MYRLCPPSLYPISNYSRGAIDFSVQLEVLTLLPASFVELNFNILLFGVADIPNVTFAAHVKIRAAYDQVVYTERTSLEAEPLPEVC